MSTFKVQPSKDKVALWLSIIYENDFGPETVTFQYNLVTRPDLIHAEVLERLLNGLNLRARKEVWAIYKDAFKTLSAPMNKEETIIAVSSLVKRVDKAVNCPDSGLANLVKTVPIPQTIPEEYVQSGQHTEVLTYTRKDYIDLIHLMVFLRLISPTLAPLILLSKATYGDTLKTVMATKAILPVIEPYPGYGRLWAYYTEYAGFSKANDFHALGLIPEEAVAVRDIGDILLGKLSVFPFLNIYPDKEPDNVMRHVAVQIKGQIRPTMALAKRVTTVAASTTEEDTSEGGRGYHESRRSLDPIQAGDYVLLERNANNLSYHRHHLKLRSSPDEHAAFVKRVHETLMRDVLEKEQVLLLLYLMPQKIFPAAIVDRVDQSTLVTLMASISLFLYENNEPMIAGLLVATTIPPAVVRMDTPVDRQMRVTASVLDAAYPYAFAQRSRSSPVNLAVDAIKTLFQNFQRNIWFVPPLLGESEHTTLVLPTNVLLLYRSALEKLYALQKPATAK